MRRPVVGILAAAVLGCTGLPGAPPPPMADPIDVVVLARPVAAGEVIEAADLAVVPREPRYLPEGVFLQTDHVERRIARIDLLADEYVHATQLAGPDNGEGMQGVIPKGMRSVTLPRAGLAAGRGSYVDVWWTPPDADPCAVVQAAFVLGHGGAWKDAPDDATQVQLLTTPSDAVRLLRAARSDSFRYGTRSELDIEIVEEVACSR